ncbi:hypothetical protein KI387_008889 [Taxus chinensis]|uniref:PGG domain-containing protein n=1 Tax=Taxus chinensis TaxID=29808 RepID=A0AA38CPN8_TAXCH|nr:hypothetical protein KI387_008889 [Taxus chinensis]
MQCDLFIAAKRGNLKTLRDLHSQNAIGSYINQVTFEGNTVLHIAAREGHLELVKWILHNAKWPSLLTGARNSDKNTPLHEAAKMGNQEVVRILLKHNKYAAHRRNQFGETPLIIASEHGHVESARLLLAATPLFLVFWPRENRQTCLNTAAYGGHLDVVRLILKEKPSCLNMIQLILFVDDENGVTPLHAAVHGGHLEIVGEILNTPLNWWCCGLNCCHKSLMTKKDKLGRCAIHIAAMKGYINIVDLFMSRMPDCVEIRSSCLKTAVHFAVEYNQINIVKKLVSENEDEITTKLVSYDFDLSGNTALHLAAMNAVDPELMEYLLSFPNVNFNAINNEGLSPLDIAVATPQNKPEFGENVTILENHGASHSLIRHSRSQLPPWKHSQQSTSQGNCGMENKILDVDTLVASLIATVTFAAIFQIPGGINEGDGLARMSLETVFQVFLFSDCVAFFASMTVVICWIFRERLQTRLIADRSPLAKLSMLSLGTSIVSTCLAFLCATILVTVPRNIDKMSDNDHLKEYRLMFAGEIIIAYVAPLLAVVFLSLAWILEYNFHATNERQARLKWQLKRVLISTLPVAAIVLTITFVCITRYL